MADSEVHGRRIVPATVDYIASQTPNRTFASIPRENDLKDGFRDVTFYEFANAINRMAKWFEDTLGRSGNFETIAYLGQFDLRYPIAMIAASKLGFKMLLPSPRNSLEGQVSLFAATQCTTLLISENYQAASKIYLEHYPMKLHMMPELSDMLSPVSCPPYPFVKTYQESARDPFIILHTSGSTGLPKPITITHGWMTTMDAHQAKMSAPWLQLYAKKKMFCSLPPFHAAGFTVILGVPLYYEGISVWPPSNVPVSANLIEEYLNLVPDLKTLFAAPSILEDLSRSTESLERMGKLEVAGFGGGPLSIDCGDRISTKTRVVNTIGSTEICIMPLLQPDPEDWRFFHASQDLKGLEFRPKGDGLFELFLVRHPLTDTCHAAFQTFPDLQEYSMNDRFSKHPTKPGYWLYMGRADDVVVLSNGEKLNPLLMEEKIRAHPKVKGALVVGQGRFETALVIELTQEAQSSRKTADDDLAYMEDIWRCVEDANKTAPGYARLARDHVIFAAPDKPFARATKGTIQRQATIKLYQEEIAELYARETSEEVHGLPKLDLAQHSDNLQIGVGRLVTEVTGFTSLAPGEDLFGAGMDSLHVLKLVKSLRGSVKGLDSLGQITQKMIYGNPSVITLTTALKAISNRDSTTSSGTASREAEMREILQHHLQSLRKPTSQPSKETGPATCVLLTGSTGSLGSYLLEELFNTAEVSKIYCLNRRADGASDQERISSSRGLKTSWDDRVHFLKATLSQRDLGLSPSMYEEIKESVSVIIHNQWQVDFNLSLPSFAPHIEGTKNLIALSAEAKHGTPIYFLSSIGTVGQWEAKYPGQKVPEGPLNDPSLTDIQGYSESKWIAEQLLQAAADASGVSSAICRIGQIAGPVEQAQGEGAVWNRQEWLPSLIASSQFLGAVPNSLASQNNISWTPVDVLSRVILELVLSGMNTSLETAWTRYYNVTNPTDGNWTDLVPIVQARLMKGAPAGSVKAISLEEWVQQLENSGREDGMDVAKNPGFKLLDFYRSMANGERGVKLDTTETSQRSNTLRCLKAVDAQWMELWLRQWDF